MEAKQAGNLARRLKVLTHPALLVVDEIGYLPVSQAPRHGARNPLPNAIGPPRTV